jgi:ATP-dependent Lhr-like helicase
MAKIPSALQQWFDQRGWTILPHQTEMAARYQAGRSTLLTAPTGTGKTLAGFLGSLIDITESGGGKGLHTLYISPLKALNYDIERNVLAIIDALNLPIRVESRTGDTTQYRRQRQRTKPPDILLTTPESLMLLLTYPEAAEMFGKIKAVVIDEIHQVAASKRGDLIALALAQLEVYSPGYCRIGLSATVSSPDIFCKWLGPAGRPAEHLDSPAGKPPKVAVLKTKAVVPYSGFIAQYAVPEIVAEIAKARTTIVFVNTRHQAELLFQYLWEANADSLPIAIYHASLTREMRLKTLSMMTEGKIRALVATSAIELGIDWGDVDVVIQVGAPKGVSRLLQRIGRSNHKVNVPSKAFLVPANRFEVLECEAAITAIAERHLDGGVQRTGHA